MGSGLRMARFLFNLLRPRQNGRLFPDHILKKIFLNENIWILLKISLKFVARVQINNIPALVQIIAWRRPGDKPLSEPMMVSLLTHICVTRPQSINTKELTEPVHQYHYCNYQQWYYCGPMSKLWVHMMRNMGTLVQQNTAENTGPKIISMHHVHEYIPHF